MKDISFTKEELNMIKELIGKTRKKNGSRELEVYKDILDKIHNNGSYYNTTLTDTVTDKEWLIYFTYVAFPGLTKMGQRVNGFHKTGMHNGFIEGDVKEFGTLIISDGVLKIVQW